MTIARSARFWLSAKPRSNKKQELLLLLVNVLVLVLLLGDINAVSGEDLSSLSFGNHHSIREGDDGAAHMRELLSSSSLSGEEEEDPLLSRQLQSSTFFPTPSPFHGPTKILGASPTSRKSTKSMNNRPVNEEADVVENKPKKMMEKQPKVSFLRKLAGGLGFAIVCVAAYPLAMLFPAYLKLPIITGYLLIGVVAGPFLTGLLSKEVVGALAAFVNNVSLSFIAFQAGQELYWPDLRPHIRNIAITLSIQYVFILATMTTILSLAAGAFFYGGLMGSCPTSVALLFAAIGVAISPATALAIQLELKSAGPFTNLMIGMVMISDFLVLVTFSVARIVATITCTGVAISGTGIAFTFAIVLSNLLIGAVLSILIIGLLSIPKVPKDQNVVLHYLTSLPLKGLVWMAGGFGWFTFTEFFSEFSKEEFGEMWEVKFEKLLVLMIASCIAGHRANIRHDMHVILDTAAPYVFLPFFTMTGAAMKLDQVAKALPLSATYVAVRWFSLIIGTFVALKFVLKKGPEFYTNLWMCFTPQAGVTLGLATEVQMLAPDTWGPFFAATIVGGVVIAQLFGPVLCSLGVKRSGEAGKMTETDGDGHHQTPGKGGDVEKDTGITTGLPGAPGKMDKVAVIGDSELAFEIAMHLAAWDARVKIPVLGSRPIREQFNMYMERAETQAAKNIELVDHVFRTEDSPVCAIEADTDVVVFVLDVQKTKDYCELVRKEFPTKCPRLVAMIADKSKTLELHRMGVFVIQPNITLARFATNMCGAPDDLAYEISLEGCGEPPAQMLVEEQMDFMTAPPRRQRVGRRSIGQNMINLHGVDSARASRYVSQVFMNFPAAEPEYPPEGVIPYYRNTSYRVSTYAPNNRTSYAAFGVGGGARGGNHYNSFLSPRDPDSRSPMPGNYGVQSPYARGSIAFNNMMMANPQQSTRFSAVFNRPSRLQAISSRYPSRQPLPPPPESTTSSMRSNSREG